MDTNDRHRIETSLAARISTDEGTLVDCVIRDLSEAGAKLEVASSAEFGPEIALKILQTGEIFRAEVRWRYANKAGVRFVKAGEAALQGPSREALIAENLKLWEALESLATRLTQLGEHVTLPDVLRVAPSPTLTAAAPPPVRDMPPPLP